VFYRPDQSNRDRSNRLDQYDAVYGTIELPGANHAVVFPLHPRGLAVEIEPSFRAEPLSTDRDPAWDKLVSLGQLDALDETDIQRLAYTSDPLLKVAAAYACYANSFSDTLYRIVMKHNLPGDEPWADREILWHAVGMLFGNERARIVATPSRQKLDLLAQERRVPVFRWGIGIGQQVAVHYGSDELATWFSSIEERLALTSTWTAWTPAEKSSWLLTVTD
jgi:hypothetical protein